MEQFQEMMSQVDIPKFMESMGPALKDFVGKFVYVYTESWSTGAIWNETKVLYLPEKNVGPLFGGQKGSK